jgi:hypothetical protein
MLGYVFMSASPATVKLYFFTRFARHLLARHPLENGVTQTEESGQPLLASTRSFCAREIPDPAGENLGLRNHSEQNIGIIFLIAPFPLKLGNCRGAEMG